MLKKTITIIAIFSLLTLFIPPIQAQETGEEINLQDLEELEINASDLGLAEPTILPDSIFYPFKKIIEKITEAFTFQEESKAKLNMKLASKRLLEARKLIKLGKKDLALKILENYNKRMENARKKLKDMEDVDIEKLKEKQKKRLEKNKELFTENFFKHIKVLERVKEQVPEEAKEVIEGVIEKSRERIEERISRLNPEDAQKAKERLDEIINRLPGDEVEKIEYLKTLREIKSRFKPPLKEKIEILETERIEKIKEFLEQSNLSEKERESILKNLSKKLEKTKEKMSDLQNKIINELPEAIRTQYDRIRQHIQERSEEKDGGLEILPTTE